MATAKIRLNLKFIYFLLGMFSTMQVIEIKGISAFTIALMMTFAALLFDGINIKKRQRTRLYFLFMFWIVITLISTAFGYIYFWRNMPEFASTGLGYVPKIILYTLLLLLMRQNDYCEKHIGSIAKGLYYGILINLIWASLDAIIYYLTGISITNTIFSSYIQRHDVRYGMLSLAISGVIRAGGLNGDPANIGIFAVIMALYSFRKRDIPLIMLTVFSAFASVSFIAILGIIIAMIVDVIRDHRRIRFYSVILVLGIGFAVALYFSNVSIISRMVDAVIARADMKVNTMDSSNARLMYWVLFLRAIFAFPISLFVGTGYGTASYPYFLTGLLEHEYFAYDPECTYFSMFFNVGLPGFIIFMMLYIGLAKKMFRNMKAGNNFLNSFLYAGILGSMIAFLGYHYTLYSVVMLLTICATLHGTKVVKGKAIKTY